MPARACSERPLYAVPNPRMTPDSALRVLGSKVLNSWSRSTAVVVSCWVISPPSRILGAVPGARVRSM
jgi:hypothetical protein